jgi:hypothetical protein
VYTKSLKSDFFKRVSGSNIYQLPFLITGIHREWNIFFDVDRCVEFSKKTYVPLRAIANKSIFGDILDSDPTSYVGHVEEGKKVIEYIINNMIR